MSVETADLPTRSAAWRDAYARARHREGRLLPDDVVAALPRVAHDHPLAPEWRLREDSCSRLLRYLRARPGLRRVLDAGCGNGWLAARIATLPGVEVVAVDVNAIELDQARRVFRDVPNLTFVDGDILSMPPPVHAADIVVLASVVQYVPRPAPVIAALLEASAAGCEVHVLDTPVYETAEVSAARSRTRRHYARIGVPEMADAYRHHDWDAFEGLSMDVLYRPGGAWRRIERGLLRRPRSPFVWLRFTRQGTRP